VNCRPASNVRQEEDGLQGGDAFLFRQARSRPRPRPSRGAAKDSFAATRLIRQSPETSGCRPGLHSLRPYGARRGLDRAYSRRHRRDRAHMKGHCTTIQRTEYKRHKRFLLVPLAFFSCASCAPFPICCAKEGSRESRGADVVEQLENNERLAQVRLNDVPRRRYNRLTSV